jgi:hypothetical protein
LTVDAFVALCANARKPFNRLREVINNCLREAAHPLGFAKHRHPKPRRWCGANRLR